MKIIIVVIAVFVSSCELAYAYKDCEGWNSLNCALDDRAEDNRRNRELIRQSARRREIREYEQEQLRMQQELHEIQMELYRQQLREQ